MSHFLLSILALTTVFWLLYKQKVVVLCPICIAVVLTWAGGLLFLYLGFSWTDPFFVGVLMGASLGALAEKYGEKWGLVWKTVTVLLGFAAVYNFVQKMPYRGAGLVAVILAFTWFLSHRKKSPLYHGRDLLKDCC